MIRVFILDNSFLYDSLKSTTELVCYIKYEELKLRAEMELPAEGLPDGYDLYSLHVSLIRPLEEQVINLRRKNPDAYILMRNTIHSLDDLSRECINSANEWCSKWIGKSLQGALKGIIEKRRSELP